MGSFRRWLTGGLSAVLALGMLTAPTAAAGDVTPVRVPGLERIKAITAAGDSYAALRADGTVWTGYLDSDDDGDGLEDAKQVSISCPVRAIAAGADRVAMLCANGTVWTAGIAINEPGGQRALQAPGLERVTAVDWADQALVSLRDDGTVWVSEFAINEQGVRRAEQVPDLSGVIAVAGGRDDAVAITADGAAWRLAINTKGTSVKREADLPPVRSVALCGPAGEVCDPSDPDLFVTGDGKVLALVRAINNPGVKRTIPLGDLDRDGHLDVAHGRILSLSAKGELRMLRWTGEGPGEITTLWSGRPTVLKAVARGTRHDMGLAADGTVWVWAAPAMLTRVPELEGIKAIASGGEWHLALAADGRLFALGRNSRGTRLTWLMPQPSAVRGIAAAPGYYVTLNMDGTIAAGKWPAAGAPPAEPIIHRDIAARSGAAGPGHVILIKIDGRVAASEIAIDEAGVHFSGFKEVAGLESAVRAAAGSDGFLVLRADGTVWGGRWGSTPVQVKDVAGARGVAAGGNSYAVMLGDGSVRGIAMTEAGVHIWGDPHVDGVDEISAGGGGGAGGIVMLRADGTAATASRTVGAGVVADIIEGIAVAAGTSENLVLKADGTVWNWPAGVR